MARDFPAADIECASENQEGQPDKRQPWLKRAYGNNIEQDYKDNRKQAPFGTIDRFCFHRGPYSIDKIDKQKRDCPPMGKVFAPGIRNPES